jgi:hypothetical protein
MHSDYRKGKRPKARPATAHYHLIERAALQPGWALPSLHDLDERRARRWAAHLLPLGERACEALALAARQGGTTGQIVNRTGWLLLRAVELQRTDAQHALAAERAAHASTWMRLAVLDVVQGVRS